MTSIFAPAIKTIADVGLAACLTGMFGCALWAVRR
jgi:hypothetical protein